MYSTIPDKKIIQQGREYLMIYRGPGFLQSYDLAPPRREIITVRGQSYVSRLPKY